MTAFILFLLLSCLNQSHKKDEKHVPIETIKTMQAEVVQADPLAEKECVQFNIEMLKDTGQLINYIISLFPNDFEGISANHIESVKHGTTAKIDSYGGTEVFIINVASDQLASIISPVFYLFINKEKKNAVLFPFTELHLIKRKLNDEQCIVSGIFKIGSKGYYLIYQYSQDGRFKCIFNSLDSLCNNGIPVYNSSLDCMSYKPFALELKNIDVNNDGLLDLLFSGKALFFCEGLEIGYGREDRKPINELDLNIQFLAYRGKKDIHWRISDTTLCNQLNK